MAKEPDNLVLRKLREIRETLSEHTELHKVHSEDFRALNKRLDRLTTLVIHTLGESNATQFQQVEQESRIDELFVQLEKLLKPKEPA